MITLRSRTEREKDTSNLAQNSSQGRENVIDGGEPNKEPARGERAKISQNTGISGATSQIQSQEPDMMEAWRESYRIFSRYAPSMRAAVLQDEDNRAVAQVFTEALPRIAALANMGGDAAILAAGIYEMLDKVWRDEREARKAQAEDGKDKA